MNREELRAAIDQPAANTKVSYDPGLVETLLDDSSIRLLRLYHAPR